MLVDCCDVRSIGSCHLEVLLLSKETCIKRMADNRKREVNHLLMQTHGGSFEVDNSVLSDAAIITFCEGTVGCSIGP